jgi:copper chaperone CopZ
MSTWQIAILCAMAGCATGCLLWICRAVEKLAKAFISIGNELKKINEKIEKIEAVNSNDSKPTNQTQEDTTFEEIEAAIASFEKLKRIDLTSSE